MAAITDADLLAKVKSALGITGDYQNDTLTIYIGDVKEYMKAAGVNVLVLNSAASVGAICRGVADLWNYGAGDAEFSAYFRERVTQLVYTEPEESEGGE